MIAAWVIFPLALTALCLGLGLLAERASGRALPGALLPPLGLATLSVLGLAITASASTAGWATPVAALLGLAGFALTERRLPLFRPDRGALAVAVAVFLVFGAPVILSGEATFAGYIKLDDTATWFALTDRLMEHSRSLDGLAPSTYEATLSFNLAGWYPFGAFVPLGVGGKLAGQELAWIFQPYLARWGGIKELLTVALLGLAAALLPLLLEEERPSFRALLPLAIATAALVGALSFGAGPWLLGLFGAAALLLVTGRGFGALRTGGLLALWLAPLILFGLVGHPLFPESDALLNSGNDLGNLAGPISPLHAVGIWPAADFRVDPDSGFLTGILILVAGAAALLGAWRTLRDRDPGLLAALGGATLGGLLIFAFGGAWVSAKAFAVVSPFVLLFAFAGVSAFARLGFRALAGIAAALIAIGVIWSNVLGYGGVSLSPRDQLAELERIGDEFAGVEPALMTEYQAYGARHFLREMAPEGASELRRRTVALSDGGSLEKGETADIDRFALPGLLEYQALVLRRSPALSRPPQPFALASRGRFYEVWQQTDSLPTPSRHLGLGSEVEPAGVPACADIRRMASGAGGVGSLIAAPPPAIAPIALQIGPGSIGGGLIRSAAGSTYIDPVGAGQVELGAKVARAGAYEFWLGGSLRPSATLAIDGEEVGAARHQLNTVGNYIPLGSAELDAGAHTLALEIGGPDLHPGSAGSNGPLGPLIIAERPSAVEPPLTTVPAADAEELCGQAWDWIEAVAG